MAESRILIIDDDNLYRTLLKETFSRYQLDIACSGEQGIEKAQSFKPDLILLDIFMTGMSGFDVCTALRKITIMQNTPIVFISNLSSQEGRIKAFDIGANDFICKDVHPDEIKIKIESILNAEKEYFAVVESADEAQSLLVDLQRQNAYMKSISLFIQASYYCNDMHVLIRILMNTIKSLELKGVVTFKSHQVIASTSNHVAKLEHELLNHHQELERIQKLAHGAIIYNWRSAVFLAKNVGEQVDIVAHLMDAVEIAVSNLERQSNLITQILSIEENNKAIASDIQNSVDNFRAQLKSQLFQSGLISQFDLQDDSDFDKLIADSGQDLFTLIGNFNGNTKKVSALLMTLKKPPLELRFLFKEHAPSNSNVIF